METKLKVGDTVRLKSFGPPMTIKMTMRRFHESDNDCSSVFAQLASVWPLTRHSWPVSLSWIYWRICAITFVASFMAALFLLSSCCSPAAT